MSIRQTLSDAVSGITNGANIIGNAFNTVTGNINVNDPTGLSQSTYDFNSRVFPDDLANDYNGHYMVININIPVNASGVVRGGLYDAGPITSTPLLNEFSKVDNLRFNPQFAPPIGTRQAEQYALQRSTRRIAESIALHMPTPVIFSSSNAYEDVSLTAIGGQIGKLAVGAVGRGIGAAAGAFFNRSVQGAVRGAQAGGAIADAAGNAIGTAFQLAGYPINPRVEVLFATTIQRQFTFEVLMAPRNEKESESMKKIIETIRFHAAPEIDSVGPVPTYIPPAEFDITFYNKGVENTNIPRINTCVCTRIDVDYAPSGQYSTFRNGYPVAVRLGMQFQEVEVVHKLRVQQGF